MFGLQRTSEERSGDTTTSIRSMSYNCPGHKARIKAISKRVQREYFDSGLFHEEMHQAQGGDMAELVGWETLDG